MSDLLASLPLVVVGLSAVLLGVLVARALRDESVLEAVRVDARRFAEAHRAACESRAGHRGVDVRSEPYHRPRA